MRRFLVCFAVISFVSLASVAQSPSAKAKGPSDWNLIERLNPGTEIHVQYLGVAAGRTMGQPHQARVLCNFNSATEDEIVCTKMQRIFLFPVHSTLRVPRAQVASIRQGRTSVSAFLGALIGIGAGLGVSAILIASSGEAEHGDDVLLYGLLASLGGSIGSGVGRHVDFAGGPVLYVAP